MAPHQDFVDYVAEQLREAGVIRCRKMFGEYGLYCDDLFFAVICDDQLFVKPTRRRKRRFPIWPRPRPMREPRIISSWRTWRTGSVRRSWYESPVRR